MPAPTRSSRQQDRGSSLRRDGGPVLRWRGRSDACLLLPELWPRPWLHDRLFCIELRHSVRPRTVAWLGRATRGSRECTTIPQRCRIPYSPPPPLRLPPGFVRYLSLHSSSAACHIICWCVLPLEILNLKLLLEPPRHIRYNQSHEEQV